MRVGVPGGWAGTRWGELRSSYVTSLRPPGCFRGGGGGRRRVGGGEGEEEEVEKEGEEERERRGERREGREKKNKMEGLKEK